MESCEWLSKEEWELCKKKMDRETFEEFSMEVRDQQSFAVGLPYPVIEIIEACEDLSLWKKQSHHKETLRMMVEQYQNQGNREYAVLYQFLAFTVFGYGNWSNNDRRHKGLPPIRF